MDFASVFRTLTGHAPLPWQSRLYDMFAVRRIPTALDLPTGLGKTSVIAVWLAARAAGAALPRRLVYVVDRRAVVDQATEVADSIARTLGDGDSSDVVREIRQGLRLEAGARLAVSTLRGQFVDNRQWLENPAGPAIIVGTIDMVGSRLLFRGYGVSSRMRPVHAGFVGADSLIVLDEAHLVPPFERLLRAFASWPRNSEIPRARVMTLSATGRTEGQEPFRLGSDDRQDARTAARLSASKRLAVHEADAELTEVMARRALALATPAQRILVFCDSRKIAQKTAERIGSFVRSQFGKDAPQPALLVGGRRVWERAALARDPVFRRFMPAAGGDAAEPAHPAFLVATSAGEVGVDLDADHLVMDLVPWERMVQRLGRVNRRATPGRALVDVFVAPPEKDAESGVEDRRAPWRAPFQSERWLVDEEGRRDASPLGLLQLREDPQFMRLAEAASTPEPLSPPLSAPLLDAWSMTSLDEHPGRPEVGPWLRGWVKDEPQTRIVWRRHFPVREDEPFAAPDRALVRELQAFFAAAGPHLSETLEVPTEQAVDALRKRFAAFAAGTGEPAQSDPAPALVVVLGSGDAIEMVASAHELATADPKDLFRQMAERTVIVDARIGGLDPFGLLDEKANDTVSALDADAGEQWSKTAGFRVRRVARDAVEESEWPIEYRFSLTGEAEDAEQELRVEVFRESAATGGDAAIARVAQSLVDHHAWTARAAEKIAEALGLTPALRDVLVAAAAAHDAGKARAMWQNAMRAPPDGRPFAKTTGGGDYRALIVNGATYRHEFGSVADADADPRIQALSQDLRDLALHLVAAHHGYARPVIAPLDPDVPPTVAAARAREIALRFHRVQREWGVWGLAWWEALLRAADWTASRQVNEQKEGG